MKKKELNNSFDLGCSKIIIMTRADIEKEISTSTGIEKRVVLSLVEGMM